MSCGLNIPTVSRWIDLPDDPEPLRRELALRRAYEQGKVITLTPEPPEPPEEEPF